VQRRTELDTLAGMSLTSLEMQEHIGRKDHNRLIVQLADGKRPGLVVVPYSNVESTCRVLAAREDNRLVRRVAHPQGDDRITGVQAAGNGLRHPVGLCVPVCAVPVCVDIRAVGDNVVGGHVV